MFKFKSEIINLSSDVWHLGLNVPKEVKKYFDQEGNKRVICNVNSKVEWHAAIMSKGNDEWFINFNKENRKKLGVKVSDIVDVVLSKDESKYGMPLAEEMKELLFQDEEGSKLFHNLTQGKQRSLLYIINKPKAANIKLNKAITILEHLKRRNGNLDYKILNQDFKDCKF